jgi:hypothetical protein
MISGGSSSGSAAVVAAGLCPVALGVDGGGNLNPSLTRKLYCYQAELKHSH